MPLEGPDLYSLNDDAGRSGGGQSCFINSLTPRVLSLRRGIRISYLWIVLDEDGIEETQERFIVVDSVENEYEDVSKQKISEPVAQGVEGREVPPLGLPPLPFPLGQDKEGPWVAVGR